MSKKRPTVATIIVNWNTRELLRRCLDTVRSGTRAPQAVWVVDNDSTDGSPAMVREYAPDVHLVAMTRNRGFAAANNVALRAADPTDYVLLLNPDTEVPDGTIDQLLDYLEAHPEVGAAGVQLLNPDGSLQRSFDHFYGFFASFRRNLLVTRLSGRTPGTASGADTDAVEVDWLIGACVMLRTSALAQIGMMDETFYMYGEEVDLQHRIRRAGWRIVLLPWLHIIHHGGQSSKQAPLKMMLQEYRSRYLLVRKHNPPLTLPFYLGKAFLALGVWATYWGSRWLVYREADARARSVAYTTVLRAHLRPKFYARSIARQVAQ